MSNILRKSNTCAVIPFFNESGNIAEIIKSALNYVDFIIAVNDGSTDGCENQILPDERIFVVSYSENKGKGFALNAGFKESINRKFPYTITLDSDFQHPPDLIPVFLTALEDFDIVIGNRLNDLRKMPPQRIASNKLTSFLLSRKTGIKLKDTQCGFRGYRTDVLQEILPSHDGYEAESQIILNAARSNLKIGFVDIPTVYNGSKSKMKSFRTIAGFIKVLMS